MCGSSKAVHFNCCSIASFGTPWYRLETEAEQPCGHVRYTSNFSIRPTFVLLNCATAVSEKKTNYPAPLGVWHFYGPSKQVNGPFVTCVSGHVPIKRKGNYPGAT